MPPQKRPDYRPAQRLAILQIMRLRDWNIKNTAKRFVIHENTLRAWIKSIEGSGKAMRRQRIRHVRARVRSPFLNGRMERFFKSFKQWQRLALLAMRTASMQRRLDNFTGWYNEIRPHGALGFRTPQEAFTGKVLRATTEEFIPARRNARDGPNIQIEIIRRNYRDEARLPMIDIQLRKAA